MPDKLEDKVNAQIVRKGKTPIPDVSPGMLVKYIWRGPEAEDDTDRLLRNIDLRHSLNPFKKLFYFIYRNINWHNRHSYATVTKVSLNGNSWDVYLAHFWDRRWMDLSESLPSSFKNPASFDKVQFTDWETTPQIQAGETFEFTVRDKPNLIARLSRNASPETRKVVAKVLTQADLADNPFVYLSNLDGTEIYVARLSDLPIPQRPLTIPSWPTTQEPIYTPPRVTPSANPQGTGVSQKTDDKQADMGVVTSPTEIADYLDKVVRNQEDAVRSLSVAVYDHHVRPAGVKKSNALVVGPTGTGKTELARTIAELLGVPFAEVKLSGVSTTGYKGINLNTVFEDLYKKRSHPHFARSVIFLDEFDKLAEMVSESSGFGPMLQNELIGWVESANVKVQLERESYFTVNTTNMLFIGAGAFVGLESRIAKRLGQGGKHIGFAGTQYPESREERKDRMLRVEELYQQMIPDDLIQFGLKPELVGRFPILTYTKPLDSNAIIDITKNGAKSVFNQQLQLLRQGYGLSVDVDERVYRVVADATLGLGIGARGLETGSNKLFEGIKFDIKQLTAGGTSLAITPEMAYQKLKNLLPENYKF